MDFETALNILFNVRRTSNPHHKRYSYSLLGPGTLTAHRRFCLVLLHSCPDTVHRFLLRKTQTSTPLIEGSSTERNPSVWHHPCCSGLQVQGTAISPAARTLSIKDFAPNVNGAGWEFSNSRVGMAADERRKRRRKVCALVRGGFGMKKN